MKENNLLPYRRTPDKQSLNLGPLINNTMYNCDNTNTEKKRPKNKNLQLHNKLPCDAGGKGKQEMQIQKSKWGTGK